MTGAPGQAKTFGTDEMIAARDAVRVPVQQAIELLSEAVVAEKFAVSSLLDARFRRALDFVLKARDELS